MLFKTKLNRQKNLETKFSDSTIIEFSTLISIHFYHTNCNSSEYRMVRASASGAIDSGLTPSRAKPMTLELAYTASLLDAQH